MKKVIITGVTGQDGSLMADYLLKHTEHTVVAGIRRLSVSNHINIAHLEENPRFRLIDLDVTDNSNVDRVIKEELPDYFINFAANSFVGTSWKMPVNHMNTNCMAVLYQLDAIKNHAPNCRYYNAGSSEEFGDVIESPQSESHPLRPRSPYGVSKCAARHLVKVYRESYNLFAIQGWLFNHEGVRRGKEFVTRKITHQVARISKDIEAKISHRPLELGNLDALRDWSDAEDFIEGVWLMLNHDSPKEYVLASGETNSIRSFVEKTFDFAGLPGVWVGKELQEKYLLQNHLCEEHSIPHAVLVSINPDFYRPAEVDLLQGDPSLAEKELGWKRKTDFNGLVEKMYRNDYKLLSN